MPVVATLPFFRIGAQPLALEIMRIYNAGSSYYASVYTNSNGTISQGNSDTVPIQADAYGLFPPVFVPIGGAYDIKFYGPDLSPRDTYQGIRPLGGGNSSRSLGFEISSYPVSETIWVEDSDEAIWQPNGCFCWIIPAKTFASIRYFKTLFGGGNGHVSGRYSIWGFPIAGGSPEKLIDSVLPDSSLIGIEEFDFTVTTYSLIGIAMDPGYMGPGQPLKQASIITSPLRPIGLSRPFAYVGTHTHNTTFSVWPEPPAEDPKYLLARWMALGVAFD